MRECWASNGAANNINTLHVIELNEKKQVRKVYEHNTMKWLGTTNRSSYALSFVSYRVCSCSVNLSLGISTFHLFLFVYFFLFLVGFCVFFIMCMVVTTKYHNWSKRIQERLHSRHGGLCMVWPPCWQSNDIIVMVVSIFSVAPRINEMELELEQKKTSSCSAA